MKIFSMILGIGLALLWLVGLSYPEAAGWLTWLDGFGALGAFIVAGWMDQYENKKDRARGLAFLSTYLFGLWLIGLLSQVTPWQIWSTFTIASCFALMVILCVMRPAEVREVEDLKFDRLNTFDEEEKKHTPKKSA